MKLNGDTGISLSAFPGMMIQRFLPKLMKQMRHNYCQSRTVQEQHNKTIALIEYCLDELTARVDRHNSVVEHTYRLEEQTALQEEKIRVANHRIDDLEKEGE